MRLSIYILFALLIGACSGVPGWNPVMDDEGEDATTEPDASSNDATSPDSAMDDVDVTEQADPDAMSSRCTRTGDQLRCPYETLKLKTGITGLARRDVHYQVPATAPPADGYPVVLLFQGSLFSAERAFEATDGAAFGAIHQVEFVQQALDRGYAVLSPEARVGGSTFWDTNVPPYSLDWDLAPDHQFMLDIFAAVESGEFGDLDRSTMFATGISSGGYMTSRMAVSYPGEFRALAILAASYATCSGAICPIPDLPSDHPPTLFVHGENDRVVPIGTARKYHEALGGLTDTTFIESPEAGHAWLKEAPVAIADWFDEH